MLIWILFAVLTALCVVIVLRPFSREADPAHGEDRAADVAVFRAQLAEIDADVARGVMREEEAAAARTEVSRKLLHAVDTTPESEPRGYASSEPSTEAAKVAGPWRPLALVLAATIPITAVALYVVIGSPNLADQPHAPRLSEGLQNATADNLIARVEDRLRTHPDDGRGWDVIAPVYFRAGRFSDAADAYRNAARLLGETPARLIGYVKSAILANNGIVTEDLRRISERLTEMVPDRPEPRFWLGLAKEQDGNFAGARKSYKDLLATADDDDPWQGMVQKRLQGLQSPKAP